MERNVHVVWKDNLAEEFELIMKIRHSYPFVALDTEFPKVSSNTPRYASEDVRYKDVAEDVKRQHFTQLGLCFFDSNGNLPYSGAVWEFNFEGVNKNRNFIPKDEKVIDPNVFSSYFKQMVEGCELNWVTFHGLYDFAYVAQVLIKSLPSTVHEFLEIMAAKFPRVFDIKYIATFYKELDNGELGLEVLGKILGVQRIGISHTAGSDCLLTADIFTKLKRLFQIERNLQIFEGYLYSIPSRIPRHRYFVRPRPQFVLLRREPCYRPFLLSHPPPTVVVIHRPFLCINPTVAIQRCI